MAGVNEAYENQRYYGVGWQSPALLERPTWSDADGHPLVFSPQPSDDPGAWELVFDHSTDAEGWTYGSVFSHLDYARPGGRSSQRASDFVRRRKWLRRRDAAADSAGAAATNGVKGHGSVAEKAVAAGAAAASAAGAAAGASLATLVSPVFSMQGVRVRKQTELEKRKASALKLLGLLTSMFRRRHFYELVPLDPAAWPVLLVAHRDALRTTMAREAATHSIDPSTADPPAHQELRAARLEGEQGPPPQPNLLQDLLTAAIHSRAAYGYAMAAGHLSSLLNFALLQTVHQFDFCAAGGASGEANNEAVSKLAGVRPEHLVMAEWNNSVGRPCHYLCADLANRCLVLAIRGSLEIGDMLLDVSAAPMEMTLLGTQGKVHEGMMEAATYVHCNTSEALAEAARRFPGWPLLVTGHSMGGGVGAILTALLRDGSAPPGLGPARCIAIGCAAVFSAELAERVAPFTTSICCGADVVPRLSAASVEGAFLELAAASPVRTAAANLGRKVTSTLEGLRVDWKVAMRPPKLGASFGSGVGLSSLLGMGDCAMSGVADASSAAAATAVAAAKAAGFPFAAGQDAPDAKGPRGIELVARADAAAAAQLPGGSPATGPPADLLPGAAAGTLLAATGNAAVNGLGSSHEWTAAQLHLQQQPQQGGDGISVGDMHTAGISASGAATVCSASRAVHRLQLLSQASQAAQQQVTDATGAAASGIAAADGLGSAAAGAAGGAMQWSAPQQSPGRVVRRPILDPAGAGGAGAGNAAPSGHPLAWSPGSDGGDDEGDAVMVSDQEAADARAAAAEAAAKFGGAEHPEPLYMPGRVLWIIPPPEDSSDEALADLAGEAAASNRAGLMEATVRPVEAQAQANADAMDTAAHAARLADHLGPGNESSAQPRAAPAHDNGEGFLWAEPVQDDRPAKARRHSLSSSPTKPEHMLLAGRALGGAPNQAAVPPSLLAQGSASGAGAPAAEQGPGARAGVHGAGLAAPAGAQHGQQRPGAQRRLWVVAEVDRRLFGRILLSLDTMPHHLPDSYLSALQQL